MERSIICINRFKRSIKYIFKKYLLQQRMKVQADLTASTYKYICRYSLFSYVICVAYRNLKYHIWPGKTKFVIYVPMMKKKKGLIIIICIRRHLYMRDFYLFIYFIEVVARRMNSLLAHESN